MPWKYKEDGQLETQEIDGKAVPIFVGDGDKAEPWADPDGFRRQLKSANSEAAQRKARIQELTGQVESYEPLADFLTEDVDAAALAKKIRTLERQIAAAPKGGELDADTQAKIARLGELEEALAEEQARIKGVEKKAAEYEASLTSTQRQLHQLTVGREVRGSKWFSSQNGNSSLSTLHPTLAEKEISPFGRPDPDKPGRVIFYKTLEGAEKRDATDVIRDDAGNPADADTAVEVLGPLFPWWKDALRDAGAVGSDAGNLDTPVPVSAKLSGKADLYDTKKLEAFAAKYGQEALEKEVQRVAAAGK